MNTQVPQKNFFGKKNSLVIAAVVLPLFLVVIFTGIYFNLSGFFREPPKVEVQPQNNFKRTLHVVTDIRARQLSRLRCGNDERNCQPLADES